MSFSSRLFLLIVVTVGCLLAVTAYSAPYDSRLPWVNEFVRELTAGRVTAVWLLPGCLLGLWGDLPAIGWFSVVCLVAWLGNAVSTMSQEFSIESIRHFWYGDGLAGWPSALLFVFYISFFVVRRADQALNVKGDSPRF